MRVRVAQSGSNSVNKSSRRRDKSVEEKELLTEFVVSLEKKGRKEECRGKWNTTHSFIGSSRPSHCREAARTHKTWSDWHKSDLYIFGKLLKVSHSQSITHSHARTHAHACIHFYFLALVLLPHPPSPSLALRHIPPRSILPSTWCSLCQVGHCCRCLCRRHWTLECVHLHSKVTQSFRIT